MQAGGTSDEDVVDARRSFLVRYFTTGPAATVEDARAHLLTTSVTSASYGGSGEKYQAAVLEQYKLYVEMADRVSARRALANALFVAVNTGVFTLLAAFLRDPPRGPVWLLVFPLVVLVGQSLAWFWLLRSYRQLNSGKYAVVGALEELLPVSPYWRAEWQALGRGQDKSRYWPLTHLEQWLPLLFVAAYVSGFIAIVLTAA